MFFGKRSASKRMDREEVTFNFFISNNGERIERTLRKSQVNVLRLATLFKVCFIQKLLLFIFWLIILFCILNWNKVSSIFVFLDRPYNVVHYGGIRRTVRISRWFRELPNLKLIRKPWLFGRGRAGTIATIITPNTTTSCNTTARIGSLSAI